MSSEIWKSVVGYENLYEVSSFGNVKSVCRIITRKDKKPYPIKEMMLKPRKTKYGYLEVVLCSCGMPKHLKIHRLVAQAFIENPLNLPQVNHRDENKENNHVENLEWCDRTYNMNYGTRTERAAKSNIGKKRTEETKNRMKSVWHDTHDFSYKRGKGTKTSIPILQYSINNEFIREWESAREIERELGFCHSGILRCCKSTHKYNNFLWYIKNMAE